MRVDFYVRFDAVAAFVGSLMTMLVELPLFYGSCDVRFSCPILSHKSTDARSQCKWGNEMLKSMRSTVLVTCPRRFYFCIHSLRIYRSRLARSIRA